MEFSANYANKIFITVVIGMIFIVLLMYANPNLPTQWEISPNNYLQRSLRPFILNRNEASYFNKTLFVNKSRTLSSKQRVEKQLSESKSITQLTDYLFNFPWEKFQATMKTPEENVYRQKLIDGLQDYAFLEPFIPINQTCRAPTLLEPKDINCLNYPDAFLPEKNKDPVKVAHAIQLGFDADSLEIHLNELYDVIDHFFILEATRIHCKTLRKKLMWSDLSVQPRFAKFRNKVINLILDDVDVASVKWSTDKIWTLESMQEKERWEKIKQWNSITHALDKNDVIGFGDADEITSRENIQLIKYCKLKPGSLDIGIWFPFGRLDQAFASDWPVSHYGKYKYTLGDPTFYRWKDIASLDSTNYPTRQRGQSNNYLLGGIHLTYYTYLPYFMLRKLSATECGDQTHIFSPKGIKHLMKYHSLNMLEKEFEKRVQNARIQPLQNIGEDLSKITILPWFYKCNQDRYPAWKGNHDTRVA